jgi:hypothetical protein
MKRYSEQLTELVRGHADGRQDPAHGALEQVLATVDWHSDRASVGMAHDVVATVDPRDSEASALERLDDLRSRHGRDGTRHEAASYQKSGNVECQRQLVRYPDLFDEKFQAGAQIADRGLLRRPLAERRDARAELGRRVPAAVLVLLDDVGHVNDS